MLRKLIAKINKTVAERRAAPRHSFKIPIKIWFESIHKTENPNATNGSLTAWGETRDLSLSGIGFYVPSIRIQENYLVGESRPLNVELDLPGGKLQMQVIGRRYEQSGEHLSASRYLIGASISEISPENFEIYKQFLLSGKMSAVKAGSFELKIEKVD
ncbi:MAG: PilZ domain-containing protein [Acidobacteriota bacterium]|nr:PilZ domain-containing protein [Acidobacteriota bacterium]